MEKCTRRVGGRPCEVTVALDCGGKGWVVTVRHDTRILASGVGENRDEVLNRVLNELRARLQGESLVVSVSSELFLSRSVPVGEPLRAARGKLPKRGWLMR